MSLFIHRWSRAWGLGRDAVAIVGDSELGVAEGWTRGKQMKSAWSSCSSAMRSSMFLRLSHQKKKKDTKLRGEEMLILPHRFHEDGTMLAKLTSPLTPLPIHIFNTRRRYYILKQRAHEFHSKLCPDMLPVLPELQLSRQCLLSKSNPRLSMFESKRQWIHSWRRSITMYNIRD